MVTSLINDFRKNLVIVEFSKDDNKINLGYFEIFMFLKFLSKILFFSLRDYYMSTSFSSENFVKTILNFKAFSQNLFLKTSLINNINVYGKVFSCSFPRIDLRILLFILKKIFSYINLYSLSKCLFLGLLNSNPLGRDISFFQWDISILPSF